jgi:hypothetical protein
VEVTEYSDLYWDRLRKFWRVMNLSFGHEPEVFRWKHLESPAARRGTKLFLLVIDQDEVAGTLGFTECPIYVQGQKLMSCAFNDWYILPRLRGTGMGNKLVPYFLNQPAEVKLHFVSSMHSLKVVLRNSFSQLYGIADYVEYTAFMGKIRSLAQGALRRRLKLGRKRPRMKPKLKLLERLDSGIKVLDASDEQVNELLTRCQLQYPFACARDAEYLRWRYLEHPKDIGVLLQLTCEAGIFRAVFALVWRCSGISDALLLADVYYDRQRPQDLRRIMQFHRQAALAVGANSRSVYTGNRELAQAAQESGMNSVRERLNAFRNDSGIALDPNSLPDWYTCGGDSDYVS